MVAQHSVRAVVLGAMCIVAVACADDRAADADAAVRDGGTSPMPRANIPRPERTGGVHCMLSGTRAGALPRAELIALSGEPIAGAVAVVAHGEGLLVARADGTLVRVVLSGSSYTVEPVADLSGRGRLVSMVLDPRRPDQDHLFVHLLPVGDPLRSVITRLTIDPQTGRIDPASEAPVLSVVFRGAQRHGGALVFDAAGMLLIGLGDGGDGGQMYRDSMDPLRLPGKLLRIDVEGLEQGGYAIPADNPFAMGGGGQRPEIYALGLRDPRSCALSPLGAIYCSDVSEQRSELNRIEPGANFGWPERDGVLCVATQQLCLDEVYATPEASERHVEGRCGMSSIAFQTAADPAHLRDVAVYGDDCDGIVSGLYAGMTGGGSGAMVRADAATAAAGVDPDGALIRIDAEGALSVLGLAADGVPGTFPERLSQTGCYSELATASPADDLIEFSVRSPLWTDGAHKRRWMVIPAGEAITAPAQGPWTFPHGSILVKEFALQFGPGPGGVRPVETRFMVKRDIGWEFHAYRWNDEGTEAELVTGDEVASYTLDDGGGPQQLDYQFPGPATCPVCHSAAPGRPLGPRTEQLNHALPYEGGPDNQLAVLRSLGLVDLPADADLDAMPRLPDPADDSEPLELRVRSYLHANCAHCHQPEGWSSPSLTMDLRYGLDLEQTQICDVDTQFLATRDKRIAPGQPEQSSVLGRMLETGTDRMPPVATTVVDPLAVQLLTDWIDVVRCP